MTPIQFTNFEILNIIHDANFSKDELELFGLRNRELSYEECAEEMHMSVRNTYRVGKRMKGKILKVIDKREETS